MGKSLSTDFVILSVLLLLVASGVESVNQVLNGTRGESFYFYQSIPADDNTFLQWIFKTASIARRLPFGAPLCLGQYVGRCSFFINGTLRLDDVTPEDDGTYSFAAQWGNGTIIVQETLYDFKVYSPPTAPVLNSNSTNKNRFVSGTYVSLHCDAGDQSITSYTFFRDRKNICSEPHVTCSGSYLYFQPITASDRGNYTCVIQNLAGSNTSNSLELIESVPVSDVTLTSNASGILWPGINSTSLTCSARGTEISYAWSLKGAPLPQDPRYQLTQGNSTFIISPVSANDDGPFTCTASNWINNETSNNLTFTLAAIVSNVNLTSNTSQESLIWAEEDYVNLYCSADGTEVHFSWKLNGNPLPNTPHYQITTNNSPPSSTLTISPISKYDAGPFTCEASNLISKETSSNNVTFNLHWRPEGKINCSAEASGNDVNLMCNWPGGNPAANVSMIFNNQTTTGQNNITRSVSTSSNVQGSNLTCYGDQLGRTSQCILQLEPPVDDGRNNNSVTEETTGNMVVLTVTLREGLPCVFNWFRLTPNPGPISGASARTTTGKYTITSSSFNSSLHILDATVDDSGKYECTAKNIIGAQNFIFNVNVTAKQVVKPKPLDGGAIAGIVIGVLAAIAIIGILVFFLVRKN